MIGNHVPVGHTHSLPTSPEERGSAPLRLIAIGGLIDRKGPLQAIEAVSALRTRGIVATLDWVGNGPLEAAVHDRIDALDLNRSVSLLGQMSPQRIPELLRQAHLFVLPTSVETFGVAFAEALGQGLPVVATGRGGHLDFLPSSASRVVSTRTGEAIADAIVSLSTDPHRWSASRILEYAGDRFSDERRREAYAEIYRSLLS